MILKRHLSGVNIVVDKHPAKGARFENDLPPGRPQGSLYGQQKRLIADCVEAMRLYHPGKGTPEKKEPLIFCLTSPGHIDRANEPRFLDLFLKQLRKYGMENYVWVREATVLGFPHFHFVAECPFAFKKSGDRWSKTFCGRDVLDWSGLWSSYFGSDSRNSIRLGADHKSGKVKYFVRSNLMSNYLCKYIGKAIGNGENQSDTRTVGSTWFSVSSSDADHGVNGDCVPKISRPTKIKTFGTSTRSGLRCKGSFRYIDPEIYEPDLTEMQYSNQRRKILRTWHCVESPMDLTNGVVLSDKDLGKLHWKQCGLHPVYMGFPKRERKTKTTRQ